MPFPGLASWLTGVATFLYQKVTMENATVDPCRSARRIKKKSLVWDTTLPYGILLPCIHTVQEDSTTDKTVGKTAVAPSHPHGALFHHPDPVHKDETVPQYGRPRILGPNCPLHSLLLEWRFHTGKDKQIIPKDITSPAPCS